MGAIPLILASLVGSTLLIWLSERKIQASMNEVAPKKEASKNQNNKKKGQSKKKNHNQPPLPPADYEDLKREVVNLRLILLLVSFLFIGVLMYLYIDTPA